MAALGGEFMIVGARSDFKGGCANQKERVRGAALEVWERLGWNVIPIRQDDQGKKPVVRWKRLQTARQSVRDVKEAFGLSRQFNGLAVILGAASGGLAVRDFDDPGDYHRWAADHPLLADRLPTSETGRGFHVFARVPEPFQCHADLREHGSEGEWKADAKHYVVLPPSWHHKRRRPYNWRVPYYLDDGIPLVDDPVRAGLLPAEALTERGGYKRRLQENKSSSITQGLSLFSCNHSLVTSDGEFPGWVLAWVRDVMRGYVPTGPGQRNDCLVRIAVGLRRMVEHMPSVLPLAESMLAEVWWPDARLVVTTKDLGASLGELRTALQWSKHPADAWLIDAMFEAHAIDPGRSEPGVGLLVRLMFVMWDRHGRGAFPLSYRTANRALGMDATPNAVRKRILGLAGRLGLFELADRGTPEGAGRNAAAKWRWTGPTDPDEVRSVAANLG